MQLLGEELQGTLGIGIEEFEGQVMNFECLNVGVPGEELQGMLGHLDRGI